MKRVICAVFSAIILSGCSAENVISTEGSTSLNKVVGALQEAYESENDVKITFNPTGSGAGIQAVLEGRCDIGLSGRFLYKQEIEVGLEGEILAWDVIAVVVNLENRVDDISVVNLAKIFRGEITNWSEIGGDDHPIVCIGREAGSGTRAEFESAINEKENCRYRQELTSTGDVVTAVAVNPNAIGYVSLASTKGKVKVLSINGIFPNDETVTRGEYNYVRPFLVITKKGEVQSKEVNDFLKFIKTDEAKKIIKSVGMIPY